jgi:hypothetical protein
MIIEGQAFLRSYNSAPRSPQQIVSLFQSFCVSVPVDWNWIWIQLDQWIRIRIRNPDPDLKG